MAETGADATDQPNASESRQSAAERGRAATGLARLLPVLDWAPKYQRAWLRHDLVAGLAVAALVVPKSLGVRRNRRGADPARPLRSSLRLARVKPDVLALLRRDGVVEVLGDDHIHGSVFEAVHADTPN